MVLVPMPVLVLVIANLLLQLVLEPSPPLIPRRFPALLRFAFSLWAGRVGAQNVHSDTDSGRK